MSGGNICCRKAHAHTCALFSTGTVLMCKRGITSRRLSNHICCDNSSKATPERKTRHVPQEAGSGRLQKSPKECAFLCLLDEFLNNPLSSQREEEVLREPCVTVSHLM